MERLNNNKKKSEKVACQRQQEDQDIWNSRVLYFINAENINLKPSQVRFTSE